MKKRDVIMFVGGFLCGLMCLSVAIGKGKTVSIYQSKYKKLDLFASVLRYVENDYVEHVQPTKLVYGAIHGMLRQLDPYTIFIPPQQYKEMKSETSGEYGGPGLEITRKGKYIKILTPLIGSPAMRAGLQAGDWIMRVGSVNVGKKNLLEVRRLLRGRPGTRLVLLIYRKGWKRSRYISLIREQIRLRSIRVKTLKKGFHVIKIKSFQDRTERHLKEALNVLKKKGAIKGLVLDLRNNPGGLFDQSVRIADMFIKKGLIVSARGRNPKKVEREFAHKKHTYNSFPITVLVNRGTASAAEILAGALQDHRRGLLLGSLTFGKGSVQTIIDLSGGAGLKMTIARYYTPLGRLIHKKGMQPDVHIKSRRSARLYKAAMYYLTHKKQCKRLLGQGLPKNLRNKTL